MKGTTWKKLTRADLRKFDDIATNAILTAMDAGGVGRMNTNGHVVIRGQNGLTMSVTQNTSMPRVKQNIEADLRRVFPQLSKKKDMTQSAVTPTFTDIELPQATTSNGNRTVNTVTSIQSVSADDKMLPCAAKGCEKEFVTYGARLTHMRTEHFICKWEGIDVEHDDPNYRCDLADGEPYVAASRQGLAGHVNVYHNGHKPWMHRDNSREARVAAAQKGAATRAANRVVDTPTVTAPAVKATAGTTVAEHGASLKPTPAILATKSAEKVAPARNTPAATSDEASKEHRGLPAGEVKHAPTTPAAKLAAIRELLGEDPKVAVLQAKVDELQAKNDELQAHLDLIREALNLDKPKK